MSTAHGPVSQGHQTTSISGSISYWLTTANALLSATFLMEGLGIGLWMLWLGHWDRMGWEETPLTFSSILFLLWGSYYSVQVLGQQYWSMKKIRIVTACLIVSVFIVVARLENSGGYGLFDLGWMEFASRSLGESFPSSLQTTFLGSSYLWWRGYRLADGGLNQDKVVRSFLVGLVWIILGLLVWELTFQMGTGLAIAREYALLITGVFFLAALFALALSHLMQVRADLIRQEGVSQLFSSHWMLILQGVVVGILIVGWIIVALVSMDVLAPLLWVLSLIGDLLMKAVYYAVFLMSLIAAVILYIFQWLVSLFSTSLPPTLVFPQPSDQGLFDEQNGETGGLPFWVTFLKWGVLLFVSGLVVYLLAKVVLSRRHGTLPAEGVKEIHESVGSWDDFLRDVLIWLVSLILWFRDRAKRVRYLNPITLRPRSMNMNQQLEVREMYRRLLVEARAAGLPKGDGETPFEYLATLGRKLPDDKDALARITHDYVLVRYSDQAISIEEKGLLNRLWRNILARIRDMSKADKELKS